VNANQSRAVLWDMDGVIVDSGVYHMRSWQETFHQTGITFTDENFKHVFGMRNDEIIRAMLGKDFTQEKFEAIAQAKEVAFRRLITDNIKALPGVLKLLADINAVGFQQALVSSTPMENIDLITGKLGIKGYFRHIISGYDVTEGKPSPQCYLLAAQRLSVSPEDCMVIEDAVAGVRAAKNGGMKCIAVTNTHPAASLIEADLIVTSLEVVNVGTVEQVLVGNKTQAERSSNRMERSLVLIKPDATERNLAGAIISRFEQQGLKIVGMKLLHMDKALARRHYAVHEGKPFFNALVDYITSAPIVAIVFEGQNSIELIRKTMGATDPAKAEKGTIRADFGIDIQNNAVHGSDSPENAVKEIALFFRKNEICSD
jgi:beta-phosphoglucomutase family hydrolase